MYLCRLQNTRQNQAMMLFRITVFILNEYYATFEPKGPIIMSSLDTLVYTDITVSLGLDELGDVCFKLQQTLESSNCKLQLKRNGF